jgi:hypothetical protein
MRAIMMWRRASGAERRGAARFRRVASWRLVLRWSRPDQYVTVMVTLSV